MAVAVLDIGKTNVKLNVVSKEGGVTQTLSTPNPSRYGPPWLHHDVDALEAWVLGALAELGARHQIDTIVPCGHGSGGVLVEGINPAVPMIDYEQSPPAAVDAIYRAEVGSYWERGSPIMLGAAHAARQMLWLELATPDAFDRADAFLLLPQYWSARLTGIRTSEVSSLGAQSHLWQVPEVRFSRIVGARGWQRLLPTRRNAWNVLGPLRADVASRTGLSPRTQVLCGVHDSTANFYRYQAAGITDVSVVSTGTWIVAMSATASITSLSEARGMVCNADVEGRPLPGALCMGGREFSRVLGTPQDDGVATPKILAALVASGTMALPWFGSDSSLFPERANQGRIVGSPPDMPGTRRGLALLYVALLTDAALDALGATGLVVLDGSFVTEPLYGALVAALRPQQRVRVSRETAGPTLGAALLTVREERRDLVPLALDTPPLLDIPGLADYRARWMELASRPESA